MSRSDKRGPSPARGKGDHRRWWMRETYTTVFMGQDTNFMLCKFAVSHGRFVNRPYKVAEKCLRYNVFCSGGASPSPTKKAFYFYCATSGNEVISNSEEVRSCSRLFCIKFYNSSRREQAARPTRHQFIFHQICTDEQCSPLRRADLFL